MAAQSSDELCPASLSKCDSNQTTVEDLRCTDFIWSRSRERLRLEQYRTLLSSFSGLARLDRGRHSRLCDPDELQTRTRAGSTGAIRRLDRVGEESHL